MEIVLPPFIMVNSEKSECDLYGIKFCSFRVDPLFHEGLIYRKANSKPPTLPPLKMGVKIPSVASRLKETG